MFQLEEVQEELKRKESRWNSSTARLKNRLAEVEIENGELKEEVIHKKRGFAQLFISHKNSLYIFIQDFLA